MGYKVAIRKVATGEVRIYEEALDWPGDYLWTDGNYGCDCNRALFFAEAGGEDRREVDIECGETAFEVDYVELGGVRRQLDDPVLSGDY